MMSVTVLPTGWEPTRASLQKYAQAVTALPRAGAVPDARWGQVAMGVAPNGLVTAATPLGDGTQLVSVIDLMDHQIVISAGETRRVFDMTKGPSPKEIGDAISDIASSHGASLDVDASRYEDDSTQQYDSADAEAFLDVATSVAEALTQLNQGLSGEIEGPHLWPHGFDIATEWYSAKKFDYEGTETNAQIAVGWYPGGDAYLYGNPWPFEKDWESSDLPGAAKWNTEGWQGAKLDVSDIPQGSGIQTVVAFGKSVHDIAGAALSS